MSSLLIFLHVWYSDYYFIIIIIMLLLVLLLLVLIIMTIVLIVCVWTAWIHYILLMNLNRRPQFNVE